MKCLKEFRLSQLLTAANILHVSSHTENANIGIWNLTVLISEYISELRKSVTKSGLPPYLSAIPISEIYRYSSSCLTRAFFTSSKSFGTVTIAMNTQRPPS